MSKLSTKSGQGHIIASEPPGIFDEPVLKAVQDWKFGPKEIDGEPVETTGVRVKLEFKLK